MDTVLPVDQASAYARDTVDRYNTLLDQRRLHDILAQDLAQYIIPRKAQITYRLAPGAKQTSLLYTTVAIKANQFLASSMAGMLTPSSIRWFSLQFEEEDLNKIDTVNEWLDECRLRLFAALNRSNFKTESHEMYLDIGCFGTGAMFVEEIPGSKPFNGLRFRTRPYGTYVIAEGPDGRVDTVAEKIEMSVRAAAIQFGKSALSSASQQKLDSKMQDDPIGVIHMVQPRDDSRDGSKVSPKARRFKECYVETGNTASYGGDPGTAGGATLLKEGGYYELPYLVPRWAKSSHEVYGRGPGHDALPDIKTLNKSRELRLRAAGKWVDPPIGVVDDGVIGKVRTGPSNITSVRSKDSIFTLFEGHKGSFELSLQFEQELATAIQQVFFSDLLRMPQKNYMTAAEVTAMLEEMQRALGPVVGRLEVEFLSPLIDRTFALMMRAGVLPPIPPEVQQALQSGASNRINVVYVGPLARSQKFTDVTAVQRWLQMMAPVFQMVPTALDVPDWDKFSKYTGNAVDLPPFLFHTEDEIHQAREQKAQEAAQEKQKQDVLAAAKVAKDAGPMIQQTTQGGGPATPGMPPQPQQGGAQ